MKKDSDKKADEKKEVRQTIACSKCGSHYVYVLKDKTIVCRRCSYRTPLKE